jgi:DNA polymerase type B, organellar and viral
LQIHIYLFMFRTPLRPSDFIFQDMAGIVYSGLNSNKYLNDKPSLKVLNFYFVMILLKTYTLPQGTTLNNQIVSAYISNFWNTIFKNLAKNKKMHLMIMCKVHFTNPELGYRTLADLRRVNYSDKNLFIEYLTARVGMLNESYRVNAIDRLTFTYIIKDGVASHEIMILQNPVYKVNIHRYNEVKLPLSMNPQDFGEIMGQSPIEGGIRYFIDNNNTTYYIDNIGLTNTVTMKGPRNFSWTDTKISESVFHRVIGKNNLYIKNGEILVKSKELNAKSFNTVNTDKKLANFNNIMTIDIETVNLGSLKPYLICGYNPSKSIMSYAENLSDIAINNMFNNFIKQLLSYKKIHYVYAHNLSGFDGIFLLKHLITYPNAKVSPLIHNGKIISITFTVNEGEGENKKVRTIKFKDSFLLLPLSLRQLCKSFSVENMKGYFPVLFSDVNYIGPIPHYRYWKDVNLQQWHDLDSYYGEKWNFKEEAIKYCLTDCISLFQVILKFNELVFKEFSINIHSSLTLPSLSMNIYKALYMPENSLYQLLGDADEDIREAYTGGAVDVYIPHNHNMAKDTFNKLYYYDVNSLYPYVMSTLPMPVGKPRPFNGDIRQIDPNAYGFFYCDITSPEYLEHPILQRRVKTSQGYRTIAGLGSWTGWITSVEFNRAIERGYVLVIVFFEFIFKI